MKQNFSSQVILDFWFQDNVKKMWFGSTIEFDRSLEDNYLALYESASVGELDDWKNTPNGALALCIILDQFPLNMFRDQAKSFATEAASRDIAEFAIDKCFDKGMNDEQRLFLYLPFMHSENIDDQNRSVELFTAAGMEARWAEHHRDIVKRFGRFPHRNEALGRECTKEEKEYLNSQEAFHG